MGAELIERVANAGFMLGGTSSGIYGERAARGVHRPGRDGLG